MWSSPAFLKRGRLSSAPYPNSIYDPFLQEDGYFEGRGRKRTKFGRGSGQWRYAERTPSPDRESEAEANEANQEGPLDPADERMKTTIVSEEARDLQDGQNQERGTELSHELRILTPVEGRTSDIAMMESAVTAEEEFSMVEIPENHAVEEAEVNVSQQELPNGLPVIQRSLGAERSSTPREDSLAAEGVEEIVAGGSAHVDVESGSPSHVYDYPDDHMHSADAQHVVREQTHFFSQLESPFFSSSPLVSQTLYPEGNPSPYLSRFGQQRAYHKVTANSFDDEHIDIIAGAEVPSISTQSNQQEVVTLDARTDTLNVKETVSGALPGDPLVHRLSDSAANDSPFGLHGGAFSQPTKHGGAFSQPTTDDVSLGERWDHVEAAHKSLENPREGSEIPNSPSYLSDTSPVEIGGEVAELRTPSDGIGRTVPAGQVVEAVTAEDDVNKFTESSALEIESQRHHNLSSPQPSHTIDVDESYLSSHASDDEEDEEDGDSEDEHDERWDEEENSEDWMEGSEDDSIMLEEHSSFESDEPEVAGQVPLGKPPIEVIDLEDDDEEAESVQEGLEGPYDLSVSNISSTNPLGSEFSPMLEAGEDRGQDVPSEASESFQLLEADEIGDENALSEDWEPSQVLETKEDRGEDVLSENSDSVRVLDVYEVRDEDALSVDSEPFRVSEANEDRGEDVLSMDSESARVLEVDEGRGKDVLSMNSGPSQTLEADGDRGEAGPPVDSKPSQVLETYEAREEDVLPVDSEPQRRSSFQAHELATSTTSLELVVSYPVTDTAGRQVSLVEHHTANLLVQEPNGEYYQEAEVESKQAVDSPLPDADLTPADHEILPEPEVHRDILDPRLRNKLITPEATQQLQASSQLSSVSLQSLNGGQDLLTPRLTQSNGNDPSQLDAPLPQQRSSLLEELEVLRTSAANLSQLRSESEVPSAISPWFAPKRSSQVAPKSASDAESEHSDVESDLDSDHSKKTEEDVDDPTEIQNGHVSTSTKPISPPTGLRTSLSYFAPLASLQSHFRSTLDVLAIVITSTRISRAKSGPRDYHVTIHLADPSITASSVNPTAVSIFRPVKQALPLVQPGDAILLRDFNVQGRKHRIMLLSTNSSAWAVFRTGEEAQIRGPPVEFEAAERGFVRGLRDWWGSLGAEVKEKLRKEAPKEKELDEEKARWVDGKHELRDGTTYTDVPAKERNAIHQLRDGTTYVDEDV